MIRITAWEQNKDVISRIDISRRTTSKYLFEVKGKCGRDM
jgi:hypothetical protein